MIIFLMNLVTSAEILLFILYKYEFIYMHDAEITLIIVFLLLNVNYFRQNCMNFIYVKCLLFASTYCTCTVYLSRRLHSIVDWTTSCASKKIRIQFFWRCCYFNDLYYGSHTTAYQICVRFISMVYICYIEK